MVVQIHAPIPSSPFPNTENRMSIGTAQTKARYASFEVNTESRLDVDIALRKPGNRQDVSESFCKKAWSSLSFRNLFLFSGSQRCVYDLGILPRSEKRRESTARKNARTRHAQKSPRSS